MARLRPAFLLLAFVAPMVLAGCVGQDGPLPVPAAEADAPIAPGEHVAVDAGRGAGAEELGHLPHLHDYWLGRERVTLFEGAIEPSPESSIENSFYRVFIQKQAMLGGTTLSLPDGQIVFEGTGKLHITASWTDPAITSLGVAYRSAQGREVSPTQPLASGETFSIDVTPAMTDLPHSTTSRWLFMFSPASAPGVAMGSFDLRIEIEKVHDIALFPGHPDVFGDATMLVLHDAAHTFDEVSYPARTPNLVLTGEFGETLVTPEKPIPLDTKWMRATVHIEEATATPGEVVAIKFFFHGSDRSFVDYPYLEPVEGSFDEGHLVYAFPVTVEMTDSPYATESQWRFFVEPSTTFTGVDGPSGGMTNTHIAFTLLLEAFDEPQDGPESKQIPRGG